MLAGYIAHHLWTLAIFIQFTEARFIHSVVSPKATDRYPIYNGLHATSRQLPVNASITFNTTATTSNLPFTTGDIPITTTEVRISTISYSESSTTSVPEEKDPKLTTVGSEPGTGFTVVELNTTTPSADSTFIPTSAPEEATGLSSWGTFRTVTTWPEPAATLSHSNPFFTSADIATETSEASIDLSSVIPGPVKLTSEFSPDLQPTVGGTRKEPIIIEDSSIIATVDRPPESQPVESPTEDSPLNPGPTSDPEPSVTPDPNLKPDPEPEPVPEPQPERTSEAKPETESSSTDLPQEPSTVATSESPSSSTQEGSSGPTEEPSAVDPGPEEETLPVISSEPTLPPDNTILPPTTSAMSEPINDPPDPGTRTEDIPEETESAPPLQSIPSSIPSNPTATSPLPGETETETLPADPVTSKPPQDTNKPPDLTTGPPVAEITEDPLPKPTVDKDRVTKQPPITYSNPEPEPSSPPPNVSTPAQPPTRTSSRPVSDEKPPPAPIITEMPKCPRGFFFCGPDNRGGCCENGWTCGSNDECVPPPNLSMTNSRTCNPGSYLCPASLGYGCCDNNLLCGATICSTSSRTNPLSRARISASGTAIMIEGVPLTDTKGIVVTYTGRNGNVVTTTITDAAGIHYVDAEITSYTYIQSKATDRNSNKKVNPTYYPPGYNETYGEYNGSEGSLRGPAIGGIVVGSIFGVLALVLAAWFTFHRLKSRSNTELGMWNHGVNQSTGFSGTIPAFWRRNSGSSGSRVENGSPEGSAAITSGTYVPGSPPMTERDYTSEYGSGNSAKGGTFRIGSRSIGVSRGNSYGSNLVAGRQRNSDRSNFSDWESGSSGSWGNTTSGSPENGPRVISGNYGTAI